MQYLMFPKPENRPPFSPKAVVHQAVSSHVAENLRQPERPVAVNFVFLNLPVVSVPEMAVAENCNFGFRKREIRPSEHFGVSCWSQILSAQRSLHHLFDFRAGASHTGHVEADLGSCSLPAMGPQAHVSLG